MNRIATRVRRDRERGAIAVVVALIMVILIAAAALGMDIAKLAYERQALRAAVDAAAQAGSYALPNAVAAVKDAKDFALASAPDLNLNRGPVGPVAPSVPENALLPDQVNVRLYCAIAVKAGTNLPDMSQVPGICNPGSAAGEAVAGCNGTICVLPCAVDGYCNTIKVHYEKTVDFMFGPAINIPTGTTKGVSSAACHGICGAIAPNPMDVVVMADRTYSMSSGAVTDLKTGLKGMLATMTRQHQFVSFGAIHKSLNVSGCLTDVAPNTTDMYTADSYSIVNGVSKLNKEAKFKGTWVPVGYSFDYTTGAPATNDLALNNASSLVDSVDCLAHRNNSIGTQLASALKGAAKYVLNDANVAANVPASVIAERAALEKPVRKVIIFETDGRPDEVLTSQDSTLSLDNDWDIGASGDGEKGCTNLKSVANAIKALPDDVLIITIGYGDVNQMTCSKTSTSYSNPYGNVSGSSKVKDVLASVASPTSASVASTADKSTCAAENVDDDYYFCAANGDELSSIFLTAFAKISGNTKFIKVPGIGD